MKKSRAKEIVKDEIKNILEGTGEMAFRKHIPNDEPIPDEPEHELEEASSVPPFWKTKESEGAKEYFYGKTVGDMNGKKQGDLVLTQKGEMFKFIHGSENTTKQPFLKFVKKIKVPKFPVDDNIEVDGKNWQPLGNAEIFKLKNGKFLWEY